MVNLTFFNPKGNKYCLIQRYLQDVHYMVNKIGERREEQELYLFNCLLTLKDFYVRENGFYVAFNVTRVDQNLNLIPQIANFGHCKSFAVSKFFGASTIEFLNIFNVNVFDDPSNPKKPFELIFNCEHVECIKNDNQNNKKENKEMPPYEIYVPRIHLPLLKSRTKINFKDFSIKNVRFVGLKVFVYWESGDETIVTLQDGDNYDAEKAIYAAYVKKLLSFGYNAKERDVRTKIDKWVDKYNEQKDEIAAQIEEIKVKVEERKRKKLLELEKLGNEQEQFEGK